MGGCEWNVGDDVICARGKERQEGKGEVEEEVKAEKEEAVGNVCRRKENSL